MYTCFSDMRAYRIEKTVCHRCFTVLNVGDRYCHFCGAPTGLTDGLSPEASFIAPADPAALLGPTSGTGLIDSRGAVLVMLFAMLGPLALPMLWRSRRFSTTWKWGLTLLVVILTAAVVWLLWYAVHSLVEPLRQLQELRRIR